MRVLVCALLRLSQSYTCTQDQLRCSFDLFCLALAEGACQVPVWLAGEGGGCIGKGCIIPVHLSSTGLPAYGHSTNL